ncbi:MAG: hypothetical protein LBC86_09705 [Oscillospiraceae bacterium]|nr:hypothetical protein [Oscillospiraceae bacterium]
MIHTLTISAFADVPSKKTQIDWLISGAGGDVAALGGNPENATGEFSYDFSSEDGSISGRVEAKNGIITIIGDNIAVEFAGQFTEHFATLTRTGHFHASHRLSAKSTEEFPIAAGSHRLITFCYDSNADGGMMNAIEFDHVVKLIFNLSNGGHAIATGEDVCDLESAADNNAQASNEAQAPAPAVPDTGANPQTGANNLLVPAAVIASAIVVAAKKRKN